MADKAGVYKFSTLDPDFPDPNAAEEEQFPECKPMGHSDQLNKDKASSPIPGVLKSEKID